LCLLFFLVDFQLKFLPLMFVLVVFCVGIFAVGDGVRYELLVLLEQLLAQFAKGFGSCSANHVACRSIKVVVDLLEALSLLLESLVEEVLVNPHVFVLVARCCSVCLRFYLVATIGA
jgi:hypothetical protein